MRIIPITSIGIAYLILFDLLREILFQNISIFLTPIRILTALTIRYTPIGIAKSRIGKKGNILNLLLFFRCSDAAALPLASVHIAPTLNFVELDMDDSCTKLYLDRNTTLIFQAKIQTSVVTGRDIACTNK